MSKSRLEKFLYALYSLDSSDLPTPLSRIEELYKCLVTGEEAPTFEPISRVEKYLMAILGVYDVDSLPNPISRVEVLLYKLAIGDYNLDDVKVFLSEHEELLAEIIRNGGAGGNIDIEYVLHTLSTEFNTLYNTAEKPIKSAILKGNTLVNLVPNEGEHTLVGTNKNGRIFYYTLPYILEKNKKYILYYNVKSITTPSDTGSLNFSLYSNDSSTMQHIGATTSSGFGKIIFTTSDQEYDSQKLWAFVRNGETTTVTYDNIMLIEYQSGMENWDIHYFEGMKSVQMPVLKTTGKNLFNINGEFIASGVTYSINGDSLTITGDWFVRQVVDLKPNTTYTLSYEKAESDSGYIKTSIYTNGTSEEVGQSNTNELTFTTPPSFKDISAIFYAEQGGNTNTVTYTNIQLEEGSVATSYEPYKSNILTVNEPVELRKIGDVQDTLDCLTGEVTERIGVVVLDGSENWEKRGNTNSFWTYKGLDNLHCVNSQNTINCLCDMMESKTFKYAFDSTAIPNSNVGVVGCTGNKIAISFGSTTSKTLKQFKQELSLNPITVQYKLESPIVKTVDLSVVDQDGNNTELKTFNDITYITLSSEGLIPEAELEVATKNKEVLNTMSLEMDDISTTQNALKETSNTQSENVDATMIATTEIYEELL